MKSAVSEASSITVLIWFMAHLDRVRGAPGFA
jgi:hypothetical protein